MEDGSEDMRAVVAGSAAACFPTPPFPPDYLPRSVAGRQIGQESCWLPCLTTPPLTPCFSTTKPALLDARAKEGLDENEQGLLHKTEQTCDSSRSTKSKEVSKDQLETPKLAENGDSNSSEDVEVNVLTVCKMSKIELSDSESNFDADSQQSKPSRKRKAYYIEKKLAAVKYTSKLWLTSLCTSASFETKQNESPPKPKRKKKVSLLPVTNVATFLNPPPSTSQFSVDSLLQRPPLIDRLNVQQQQLQQSTEGWSPWGLGCPAFQLQPPPLPQGHQSSQLTGLLGSSLLLALSTNPSLLTNPFLSPTPLLGGGNSSGESYSSAFSAYNTSSSSSAHSTSSGLGIERREKAHSSVIFPTTPVGRVKRRNSEEIVAPGGNSETVAAGSSGNNPVTTSIKTPKQGHFECSQCNKVFKRLWLLTNHYRTHTGEKPFECEFCHRCFADKSNLRAHVQTHSEEKRFVCGNCGRRFAVKSYLSKHEESACGQQTAHQSCTASKTATNKRGRSATGHVDNNT